MGSCYVCKAKTYDFIEGTEFTGLMSKAIDAAPGVVGKSDVNVRFFDTSRGSDAMAMVDIWAFYENSDEGGSDEGGSSESGSTDSGSSVDSGSTESGSTESGETIDSGSTESGSTDSGSSIDSGSTDSGSSVDSGSTESGETIDSGSTESGETIDSGSTEPEIVKPDEVPNTQEQEQAAQDMANALTDESGGTKAYSAVMTSINNITVPAAAGRSGCR